jgi:hypothetical protein
VQFVEDSLEQNPDPRASLILMTPHARDLVEELGRNEGEAAMAKPAAQQQAERQKMRDERMKLMNAIAKEGRPTPKISEIAAVQFGMAKDVLMKNPPCVGREVRVDRYGQPITSYECSSFNFKDIPTEATFLFVGNSLEGISVVPHAPSAKFRQVFESHFRDSSSSGMGGNGYFKREFASQDSGINFSQSRSLIDDYESQQLTWVNGGQHEFQLKLHSKLK